MNTVLVFFKLLPVIKFISYSDKRVRVHRITYYNFNNFLIIQFQVRNHLQNVHAYEKVVPSFKCHFEDCSKIFVNNLRLQHHLKYTHEGGDQVICEICSKTFKKRSSLEEHMRIHTRKPGDRYQCEICGHYIADIRVFQRHVKNHATESLNNTCNYCGKKSPNLKALKGHIRYVHELERNFQCR